MQLETKPATPEDIPHILQMMENMAAETSFGRVFPYHPLKATETVTGAFNSEGATLLATYIENLPVGFLLASRAYPQWSYTPMAVAEIIYVEPSLRNLGLGSVLKARFKQWAIETGCGACIYGKDVGEDTGMEYDPIETLYVSKL